MSESTMLAARFYAGEHGVKLEQVPIPRPGPGEVLVKVEACGICLSDVHLIDGTLPPLVPVVTPGHESAGIIAELGDNAPEFLRVGDRVVMSPGKLCGVCRNCLQGKPGCANGQVMGAAYDGAWAEYVVVDAGQPVRIPEHLAFTEAAVLTDAVSTPYSALKDTARLRVAETVGIWGLGGLGTHAVQLARLIGASLVLAIDVNPAARDRALELGADAALDPSAEGFADTVADLTGGKGLDVVADFVGLRAVRAQAIASLGRGGRAALVGLTMESIDIEESLPFIMNGQEVRGHFGGTVGNLEELVALVAGGRLDVSRSVTRVYPLSEIHEAIAALERKEGNPVRIVITPS